MEEWERRKVRIVGVYGQDPAGVRRFAKRLSLPFPLLADPDRSAIRRYGVYVRLNFESWNMARPSVFLVDPMGRIRFITVGAHQRDWPDSADLLAVIDNT